MLGATDNAGAVPSDVRTVVDAVDGTDVVDAGAGVVRMTASTVMFRSSTAVGLSDVYRSVQVPGEVSWIVAA